MVGGPAQPVTKASSFPCPVFASGRSLTPKPRTSRAASETTPTPRRTKNECPTGDEEQAGERGCAEDESGVRVDGDDVGGEDVGEDEADGVGHRIADELKDDSHGEEGDALRVVRGELHAEGVVPVHHASVCTSSSNL